MTLVELQKQALNLSEAERRQLINTLMRSFATPKKRASFGCMQGTGEILGDIIAPALAESEWEVLHEAIA